MREYFYKTILVIFSVIICIACINFTMGLIKTPEIKNSQASKADSAQVSQYIYHSSPWYFPHAVKSTNMQFILEPFSEDYEFNAKHNSHGFRTPEYTIAHPPATFRIVIIGDSYTWGQGVKPEETFSCQLNELFKKKYPNQNVSIEVIALGVCGSRFIDNFIRLQTHAQSLNPDLVIFQFLQNDIEYYHQSKYYLSNSSVRYLSEGSFLSGLLKKISMKTNYEKIQKQLYNPESFEWKYFTSSLKALQKWSEQQEIDLFFLSFPELHRYKNSRSFLNKYIKSSSIDRFQESAIAEISKKGFNVLALNDAYKKHTGDHNLFVSKTDSHPNAFAHKIVADALFNYIIENNYLNFESQTLKSNDGNWTDENILRKVAEEKWADYNKSYEKQLLFFKQLKKMYSDNIWVTTQLAFVYQQLGDYEKSLELYESLISLAPEITSPWYRMSHCVSDDINKEKYLLKMLETIPDHSNATEELAEIYRRNGRSDKACQYYRRVASIPGHQGQHDEALKQIKNICR